MRSRFSLILALLVVFLLPGILANGCVTDPIKGVKNDPDKMDIIMNHIANDDNFREKMIEKLMKLGDRQKLAEQMVQEEDVARMLLTKIMDTDKGKTDVVSRVGNRTALLKDAIDKSLQNFENKEGILDALLANDEMVKYMKESEKLKEAFEKVE